MKKTNPSFFYRTPQNDRVDYIALVNQSIEINPSSVDPKSPLYLRAIEQYNAELNKGNTTRLEVPEGFCGYIDPDTGVFRVEPDPSPDIKSKLYPVTPTIITPITEPPLIEKYDPDKCLSNGLPGSPGYTQFYDVESGQLQDRSCGDERDIIKPLDIDWCNLRGPTEGMPEEYTKDYWDDKIELQNLEYSDGGLKGGHVIVSAELGYDNATMCSNPIGPQVGTRTYDEEGLPPYGTLQSWSGGNLWKPVNHSGNGTIVLLKGSFMDDYRQRKWASAVISADPAGVYVVKKNDNENDRFGYGRIVAPYHGRPAIRFDKIGSYFRPGPVYFVLIYKSGLRLPWRIEDPAIRYD